MIYVYTLASSNVLDALIISDYEEASGHDSDSDVECEEESGAILPIQDSGQTMKALMNVK